MDINSISNSNIIVLSKEDLKYLKGASYGVEALNNSNNEYCLATLCSTTDDCNDVHCRACETLNQNGGVCVP